MKILVIAGTGLIDSKTVWILHCGGQEVVAASPKAASTPSPEKRSKEPWTARRGFIDLHNVPSLDAKSVSKFFETYAHNLLATDATAGVRRHVLLAIGQVLEVLCPKSTG